MGYISEIRKKVGHDEIIIVGASVVVVRDGKTLLQRRRDNGLWATHGGCVEIGEDVETAARRELREETGLTAGDMTLLGVYSGEDARYTYPNGDKVSVVDVVYLCADFTGEIAPQESEVAALEWFDLSALPHEREISPLNRRPIRDAAARYAATPARCRGPKTPDIGRKLDTLRMIARLFNAQSITWALGASALLYIRGIVDDFHDLDIMIADGDIDRATAVLDTLGQRLPPEGNAMYATKHFYEYVIDGTDIDLIAGYTLVRDDKRHEFPLTREKIAGAVSLDGETVPLQALADWREYYLLMGREGKARLINEALEK